jgi:hypothetical protein
MSSLQKGDLVFGVNNGTCRATGSLPNVMQVTDAPFCDVFFGQKYNVAPVCQAWAGQMSQAPTAYTDAQCREMFNDDISQGCQFSVGDTLHFAGCTTGIPVQYLTKDKACFNAFTKPTTGATPDACS